MTASPGALPFVRESIASDSSSSVESYPIQHTRRKKLGLTANQGAQEYTQHKALSNVPFTF